jgi:DeoR family fructose operon transcriptional repressor
VVSIAEKLGTVQKIKISDISNIDYIITELPPDNPALLPFSGNEKPVVL